MPFQLNSLINFHLTRFCGFNLLFLIHMYLGRDVEVCLEDCLQLVDYVLLPRFFSGFSDPKLVLLERVLVNFAFEVHTQWVPNSDNSGQFATRKK